MDDLDTVNLDGGIRARNDPQVIGASAAGNAYGVTGSWLGRKQGSEWSNEYVWLYITG